MHKASDRYSGCIGVLSFNRFFYALLGGLKKHGCRCNKPWRWFSIFTAVGIDNDGQRKLKRWVTKFTPLPIAYFEAVRAVRPPPFHLIYAPSRLALKGSPSLHQTCREGRRLGAPLLIGLRTHLQLQHAALGQVAMIEPGLVDRYAIQLRTLNILVLV